MPESTTRDAISFFVGPEGEGDVVNMLTPKPACSKPVPLKATLTQNGVVSRFCASCSSFHGESVFAGI